MKKITENLIAPCGMNCGLCVAYLRSENKCPGCYTNRKVNNKPIKCSRKLCKHRNGIFCYECDKFPCGSIRKLDMRYRERYDFNVIGNLEYIRKFGIEKFLECQNKKYISGEGTYCIHDKKIYE